LTAYPPGGKALVDAFVVRPAATRMSLPSIFCSPDAVFDLNYVVNYVTPGPLEGQKPGVQ
jgi:hypothetical protein